MDFENFKEEFIQKLNLIEINLDNNQLEEFYKYMCLLIEWNEKMNLTAIIEPKEIILKHFIDSLTILNEIEDKKTLIDIGTGAGFPGIPLKIAKPNLKVVLLDSLNKRILFLNEVINKLELENIETIHARVEDIGKNIKYRENFEIVTSRAVANLAILSEYMIPLTKIGGKCICMKGSSIKDEINESQKAINLLGGKVEKIDEFVLPSTDIKRNIIVIKKEKNTPKNFPRKAGIPSKNPIN